MLQLQNIINNTLRPAAGYRELGGWQVPETSSADLGLALKCARNAAPEDYQKIISALAAIGREATWAQAADLALLAEKTGSPLSFLREAIGRINAWLASIERYVGLFGKPVGTAGIAGQGVLHQGGLPTAMILAGDSTALTAWALGQAVLSGSPLIVKPSNVEPLSAFLFTRALIEKGVRAPNLLFFDSSSPTERELIQKALANCAQSVVYGEDATVQAVYASFALSPAHKAIPFWTGRSGAVVYDDADVEHAAHCIVRGAALDRGNMCNSTKKVFAPKAMQQTLEARLVQEAEQLRRGNPTEAATEIGRLDPVARKMAERNSAGSHIFYDRDVILARANDGSPLLTEETPYPVVGVRYYDSSEDPIRLANEAVRAAPSGRALVMSIFTKSDENFRRALHLRAYKLQRNLPSSDVDHQQMHQGMHLTFELMRLTRLPA